MGLGLRTRTYIVVALAAAGLAVLPGLAGAAAPVVQRVTAGPAAVRAFWTPQRMQAATPLDTLPSSAAPLGSGATVDGQRRRKTHKRVKHVARYPFRTSGKVFFTVGPQMFQCSGTAVRSPTQSLVWTAGHCVYEQSALFGGYVTHWMFIPASRPGQKPYGEWPATSLATTDQYEAGTPLGDDGSAFDFGAATVATRGTDTLQSVVGARKLAFNTNPGKGKLHPFGYPATPPPPEFDGRHMFRCDSHLVRRDHSMNGPPPIGINCDMTGGASGGGWVNDKGKVVSVTSYGYRNEAGVLFGPYQGNVAKNLYRSISR